MAKPKLALIPASQGSKVFSVLPSSGVGDFDFSRSGKATRINSQGLIEEVADGQSRLDYPLIDGVVSGCPSLLLEPQATNLVPYSEDLNNFSTSNQNITINTNQTTSPSGNLADKIEENNVDGSHAMRRLTGISTISSQNYTFSFFAKKDERSIVGISNTIGGADKNAFIDIENGIILSSAFNDSSIDNYGNGWYKISLTHIATNTSDYDVRIYTSIEDGDFSHQGVVGYGFYIWGISVEQSSFSTSYIPTNGESGGVTRAAETANGSGDATTFNDSEGVLMAEISALNESQAVTTLSISDNSLSNRVLIVLTSGEIRGQFVSSGNNISRDSSGIIIENFNKIACRYTSNTFKVFVNGYQVGSTATITFPLSGITELSFDRGDGVLDFEGKTKQLQYYNSALTDSELEILTSWVSFTEMAQGQLYTIE